MFGFTKKSYELPDQSVLYFEDYTSKQVNEALVGRKGLSLFNLRDMDVPIPDFFVVTPVVYKEFLLQAFEKKLGKLLDKSADPDIRQLEKIISGTQFKESHLAEITRAYSRLSGFSNAWIAVRSSVVYPSDPSVTFSGIFHTELSVRGVDQLIDAIKQVYISVFKDKVLLYAREKNVDLTTLQMGVVIQRMVQPEVSGVAYTENPITKDKQTMSVEAVFGLGDVISEGEITPDQYTLDKKRLDITEKHIAPQEWMRIRKPADKKLGSRNDFQKIQISKSWSHQQKLEDNHLRDVAKVALIIEEKGTLPQVIEWSWESGNVWVLQTKPMEQPPMAPSNAQSKQVRNVFDVALEMMKDEQQRAQQAKSNAIADQVLENDQSEVVERTLPDEETLQKMDKKIEKMSQEQSAEDEKTKIEKHRQQQLERSQLGIPKIGEEPEMEFLLSGIGASVGKILGKLIVVKESNVKDIVATKNDILLITKYSSAMEKLLMTAGGVVMDEGGLTSDVAIISREIGIPAVVGTGLATALLKDGEYVRIDGNVGSIYRVSRNEAKAEPKKKSESKSKKKAASAAKSETVKGTPAKKSAPVPTPSPDSEAKTPTATKVYLQPAPATDADQYTATFSKVDGVVDLDLESFILANGRHPLAYVQERKFKSYSKEIEIAIDKYTDMALGNEVVLSIGSATLSQLRSLTKGSTFESKDIPDDTFGVNRLLSNKKLLEQELKIVKRIRNVYKSRNLSLAVHSPVNGALMREIKKEITAEGLKRTGTFNLFAVIDTPAEVILVDEIMDAGIDGVILNMPLIARQMQGLGRFDPSAKYDLTTNSVWKVAEDVISKVSDSKVKIIMIVENSQELLKKAVRSGVHGVAVLSDVSSEMKKAVADEEAKMIMSME